MNENLVVEKEVLLLAAEDDSGLYEVLWRLNVVLPTQSPAERSRMAHEAVRSLLLRSLVDLYRRVAPNERGLRLELDEALHTLADPVSWETPHARRPQVLVSATAEGDLVALGQRPPADKN